METGSAAGKMSAWPMAWSSSLEKSELRSLHLPISHTMPAPFQHKEAPARAPNLPMAQEHGQGMAGRSPLRSSDPKVEVPMGDTLSS